MAKAQIKQITAQNTNIIEKIKNYNEKRTYFTLVKKDGSVATNNKGHAIIYESTLPEKDISIIEAYSYLTYWAEEECGFKKYTPLQLLTLDFTQKTISNPNNVSFEQESYSTEFEEMRNAKFICKLRKSMVDLHKSLSIVDKRINQFAEYFSTLDEYRKNPESVFLNDFEEEERETYQCFSGTDDKENEAYFDLD